VTEPRNGLGIALILGGFFTYTMADTCAKFLTETMHPLQIVWARQAGFLVAALLLVAREGPGVLRTAHPYLQVIRGAMMVVSATLFITAITYVPLADAVAIAFVAPFFVMLLGAFWLGERLGPRRIAAAMIGFGGALVVLRPGLGAIHPAGALVLVAAFSFALRQVLSRVIARNDSTRTTVFYSALVSSALVTLPLPWVWTWPADPKVIVLLLAIGLLAGLGEFLVIRALEVGEAVAVAPMQYSQIIWATFWGYVVFDQFPDRWTGIGAAVIVASGAYTILREHAAAKSARRLVGRP
jgi:S-adenosylmethionine uptake transporter